LTSTNRDLLADVKDGRFRLDLYHRLAGVELVIPPLRERLEDIPVLAARFAHDLGGIPVKLAPATVAALQCERWPGNVRELRNTLERLLTLGELAPDATRADEPERPFPERYQEAMDSVEKDFLRALLTKNDGNVAASAREAKFARSHLYKLLTKHKLLPKKE
jgi:DNA-binding NtrC family response regulator